MTKQGSVLYGVLDDPGFNSVTFVPEPSNLLLMAFALAGIGLQRRRIQYDEKDPTMARSF